MRRKTRIGTITLAMILAAGPLTSTWGDQPSPVTKQSSAEFRSVVKTTLPAVVSILSVTNPAVAKNVDQNKLEAQIRRLETMHGQKLSPEQRQELLERLANQLTPNTPMQQGFGSGVIVSADGIILTNNHVVEGATVAQIRLHDERIVESDQIFRDPKTDLAIVKLKPEDAKNLPVAKLGNSDAAEIGDWVLAMGAPFGLTGSVTAGIISAKGRTPPELGLMYMDFIQTDAQINPGNSGGPIVNLDGEIVGINTAIRSSTGEFSGVAFSIPSNMAKPVVDELTKHGRVRRGYLGIEMAQPAREILEKLGLENGVVVNRMTPGPTPARKGGLQNADVIVEVNDIPIKTSRQLQEVVTHSNGQSLAMKVHRDGKGIIPLKISIDEQPEDFGPIFARGRMAEPENAPEEIKVEVFPIEKLGLEVAAHEDGLLIATVSEDSLADKYGLEAGSVILKAEGKDVKSASELVQAIEGADFVKGLLLQIRSPEGKTNFAVVRE